MARCLHCGKESNLISKVLGVCLDCIRQDFQKVFFFLREAHRKARKTFDLPAYPPSDPQGITCNLCLNNCRIPDGERSYCGLRENRKGRLCGVSPQAANLSWYYDALPTNCVADWVCRGSSKFGYKNLAVFYYGCSFDCLFCQNWHFREQLKKEDRMSPSDLADCVDGRTACICYFGGDPTVQLPHSINVSRSALRKKGKTLHLCWETNGSMHPRFLKEIADLALESGGCIKFDLKAHQPELNFALCGVYNQRTKENFSALSSRIKERPQYPLLVASTLLVPGYVDEKEVFEIASFIASLNKDIPYSLLGFYPSFFMHDLPTTSRRHAQACLKQAKEAGLTRVKIGNLHLLSDEY